MKKAIVILLALGVGSLLSVSCGSPAPLWLADAASVQELLESAEGLGNLALAASETSVLIAGARSRPGSGLVVLFAVEATPEGRIRSRRVLLDLEPDAELLDIKAGYGGDGNAVFSIAALVERPSGGDTAFFWEIPAAGEPEGAVQLELADRVGEEVVARDLHIIHFDGGAFLLYGADAFASADTLNSAMVLARAGEAPLALGRYPSGMLWEITRAGTGAGGIAVARSWREGEVFATALTLFDAKGLSLAGPRVLFTAKYLFDTIFAWDADRREFAMLWGTSHRYWFQRIGLEEGELQQRMSPSPEVRFDATVVALRPESGRYLVVLEDGRRLFSRFIGAAGELSGAVSELVGIGETGNRRLHVLAHAWSGRRLAALLSFGENFAYRLLEP
ncbi:MAG TPA: hypothetical protein VMX35_11265 [Acidobacteriota bacterium]|nr:hypothetical protein [Acidobacteriota bacterium]